MSLYLDLPRGAGALDVLVSKHGARILDVPPRGLDEVPADKALVCVVGPYDAARYVITETDFSACADPADTPAWLLMDRDAADGMCPEAAECRERWQSGLERDAEAAAHTDNLVPVARVSRGRIGIDAGLLRRYAAALRGERLGIRTDGLLTDPGVQRIAAVDLDEIARRLESWAGRDWVAVIEDREHLAGPLPPFPGSA